MKNSIVIEDLDYIVRNLENQEKFEDATILLTGCAGFLGFYFLQYFSKYANKLGIKRIIGLDNFIVGHPEWIDNITKEYSNIITIHKFDVISDKIENIKGADQANFVVHMASIASPVFYRKYPIETLDANIWGLRKLLDFYRHKAIKGFLFFSSSEIYGDPDPDFIPTPEEYRGNVATMGPRACYDEAKRFGETMCYLYAEKYNMPIGIARPFNNYGPGMKLEDKRVPADFAKAILENKDIVMLSDGTPTRTFCYISDAILGYLKILLHGKFDYFNIGIDKPEISIKRLAGIYAEQGRRLKNYTGSVIFEPPKEKDYLTHNPSRRCPVIDKAKKILNYNPTISVEDGVERFLRFFINN